jgi:hypothetical protein
MAISTGLALLGSAALSAGGSILAGNSTKKATQQAADTSMQTAAMNNALARDIYGQNRNALAPFMSRGNVAGDQINAMLGLSANNNAASTPASALSGFSGGGGYPSPNASPMAQNGFYQGDFMDTGPHGQHLPQLADPMPQSTGYAPPPQGTVNTAPAANPMDPFRQYIANSDYGFKFGEGSNALNHGYAANGSLQSGAAMKGLEKFRQNLQSGYRGEYMNLLGQQQGVGLSGASALAGVGQNYAGMVTSNNQQAGSDAANAALMRGASNANMWSGIAGGVGNALGSSYSLFGGGGGGLSNPTWSPRFGPIGY